MNKGFSLIELMMVLIIISILTSIVYPMYREYIIRARRSEGQIALLDLANRMERYQSANHTYQTATIASGQASDVLASERTEGGWYRLTITYASDSEFSLQATPENTQATNDTRCQSLALNSHGVKEITVGPRGKPTGSSKQCW